MEKIKRRARKERRKIRRRKRTSGEGIFSSGIKIKIHPLFYVLGAVSLLTNEFFLFLAFTISALLHECAHAYVAEKFLFTLNEVRLLPYGASIRGDITGAGKKEALLIHLSGPLFSGALALSILALWWLFPETYPYTEDAFYANKVLFFSNLLPVEPLDGGKIVRTLFCSWWGQKRGRIVSLALGGVAAALAATYCFLRKDFPSFFFCLSLFFGLNKKEDYHRLTFTHLSSLSRGVPVKTVAVSEETEIQKLLRFFSADVLLKFDVYSKNGEYLYSVSEEQVEQFIVKRGIRVKIGLVAAEESRGGKFFQTKKEK